MDLFNCLQFVSLYSFFLNTIGYVTSCQGLGPGSVALASAGNLLEV